jgi:parvulin-like peptidyl-prolyl isomerase
VAHEVREPDADWNAIAAKYTDEPGSKETGGDLGKFGRGQMVKAFELAAFALPVGQISDVVQSPFGFHIIQRYE